MEKNDSRNKIRLEVSLPEVLWGQETHWGPEVQGDPRERAGLSQENAEGCWARGKKELGSSRETQGTLTLSPGGP